MISSLKEDYGTITGLGATVIAIGQDTVESHRSWCDSLGGCPFPLASDPDRVVANLYGAVANHGRTGVRAIFVLDETGTIVHKIPWYQPGHVGQFLEIFQALGLR